MAISFKQLIAPAQVDDVEAAQRRQALAEAMQQRAMQPNLPQVGGPVQAKYGAGNALVDLANSLASAWNLKNANSALARAKDARNSKAQAGMRTAIDQAVPALQQSGPATEILDPMTGESAPPNVGGAQRTTFDPSNAALKGIVGGMDDPVAAQKALSSALMERTLAATDPRTIADRELKAYQIQAGIQDKRDSRAASMERLQMQIRAEEAAGRRADDLRRQLAEMQAAAAREAEAGRNERAAADRRSREAVAEAKTDAAAETKTQGADSLDSLMAQLRSSYGLLKDSGGIADVDKGGVENAQAAVQSSAPGQFLGRVFGTKNQSERNSIAQTRPLLLAAIKDATGMSARQLDSNAELKLWLSAATDPTLDVQSNIRALDNIDAFVKARAGQRAAAPSTAASPTAPGGDLTPDEAAELEALRKRFNR